MKTTIDISATILEQLSEDLQEVLYWRANMMYKNGAESSEMTIFTSEEAALCDQRLSVRLWSDVVILGRPFTVTKDQVIILAKTNGWTCINVENEQLEVVEIWQVPQ